jgi:hypothetical protein
MRQIFAVYLQKQSQQHSNGSDINKSGKQINTFICISNFGEAKP